jgi:hypothetical protein
MKTYYCSFHSKEQKEAIQKLEELQLLLALCMSNWKADHVLGNMLLAAANDSDMDSDSDTSLVPSKKQSSIFKQARKKEKEKARRIKDKANEEKREGMASNINDPLFMSPGARLSPLFSSFQLISTTTDIPDVHMRSLFPTSSKVSGMKHPQLLSSPQKQNAAKKKRQYEHTTTSNSESVIY